MTQHDIWQSSTLWRKQVERRLFELGSLIKGNLPVQADRISDVVEQIDELRHELQEVKERQDKIANWLKKHHKNGDSP